jgi:hypothetical protein
MLAYASSDQCMAIPIPIHSETSCFKSRSTARFSSSEVERRVRQTAGHSSPVSPDRPRSQSMIRPLSGSWAPSIQASSTYREASTFADQPQSLSPTAADLQPSQAESWIVSAGIDPAAVEMILGSNAEYSEYHSQFITSGDENAVEGMHNMLGSSSSAPAGASSLVRYKHTDTSKPTPTRRAGVQTAAGFGFGKEKRMKESPAIAGVDAQFQRIKLADGSHAIVPVRTDVVSYVVVRTYLLTCLSQLPLIITVSPHLKVVSSSFNYLRCLIIYCIFIVLLLYVQTFPGYTQLPPGSKSETTWVSTTRFPPEDVNSLAINPPIGDDFGLDEVKTPVMFVPPKTVLNTEPRVVSLPSSEMGQSALRNPNPFEWRPPVYQSKSSLQRQYEKRLMHGQGMESTNAASASASMDIGKSGTLEGHLKSMATTSLAPRIAELLPVGAVPGMMHCYNNGHSPMMNTNGTVSRVPVRLPQASGAATGNGPVSVSVLSKGASRFSKGSTMMTDSSVSPSARPRPLSSRTNKSNTDGLGASLGRKFDANYIQEATEKSAEILAARSEVFNGAFDDDMSIGSSSEYSHSPHPQRRS